MVTEWHWVLETPTSNTSSVVPDISPSLAPSREPGNEDRWDVPYRHPSFSGVLSASPLPSHQEAQAERSDSGKGFALSLKLQKEN